MAGYEDLRVELLTRIGILEARADHIEADLRRPGDRDSVERANDIENDEVLNELDGITRSEVAELWHAVQRIDNGTYGHCEKCGGDISHARLEALPATALCVRCASAE